MSPKTKVGNVTFKKVKCVRSILLIKMCQSFPAAINPNPFPPAGDHFRGNTHSCLMEQDFQPHFRTGCQQESIFLSSDSSHSIETTDLIEPLVEVVDGVVEGQDDQLRHPLCAHVAWKQDLSFLLLEINIFARYSCDLMTRFDIKTTLDIMPRI